jgi:DNA-binding LytR/AlgR family response regulator
MDKIIIKQIGKSLVIDVNDIVFCCVSENYTIIHFQDKKSIISTKCLTKFAIELNDDFVRVSQSCLVSMHYIVEIISQTKKFKQFLRSIKEKRKIESKNIRIKELKDKYEIEINLLDEML